MRTRRSRDSDQIYLGFATFMASLTPFGLQFGVRARVLGSELGVGIRLGFGVGLYLRPYSPQPAKHLKSLPTPLEPQSRFGDNPL